MPRKTGKKGTEAQRAHKISSEKPLSLAPLTPEEAIKWAFGVDPKADRSEPHSAREEIVHRIADAMGDAARASKNPRRRRKGTKRPGRDK